MGSKNLSSKRKTELNQGKDALEFVNDRFDIRSSVTSLHQMMQEVTKDEFSAKNVNAACNCVAQLNQTINTTIKAAKFLTSSKKSQDEEE